MATDRDTTVSQLRNDVRQFVGERQWEKFHSPKNISMAMSVEVAELMEHFQWLSQDESQYPSEDKLVEIGEEISDVFCYLMAMANSLNVDLTASFKRKMEMNRAKYPVEQFRGRFGNDDPTQVQAVGSSKETNDA